MANNIWAIVLSIIILFIILLILWFLFQKKVNGNSSKNVEFQKEDDGKDTKEQKVEEAQYRELNEEEKEKNENLDKDYKYDKDKVRNKLKELE